MDPLEDPNEFDRYAREHGGWFYDNGWGYKGEYFGSAYVRDERSEGGRVVERLVMVRGGKIKNRTLVLHETFDGVLAVLEVWSGIVASRAEFDAMNAVVAEYVRGQPGLSATDPSRT